MKVTVVLALAQRQWVQVVELPPGATVREAVAAAALHERLPGIEIAALRTGIWSKECGPEAALRDGDRVELYRELHADPKALRRSRAGLTPSRRARSGR